MTNDEARMKKQAPMTNDEALMHQVIRHSEFVIDSAFGFRHSSLKLSSVNTQIATHLTRAAR
jgi:hypothetical protein